MKPIKENREQGLLDLLNAAIKTLHPIKYEDLNVILPAKDEQALIDLKGSDEKLGVTIRDGKTVMTTLSLIATITDVLCDKRLVFELDEYGVLNRVSWFKKL